MVEGNENTVFLHENGIGGVTYGYEIQAYRFENGRMILGEKSQAIQIVYKKSEIPPASMEPQVSEEPKNSEGPYVPPAPVITSISVVDNGVKIEWDEVKDAAGYVLKCFQEGVGTAIFNVRREGNGNVRYIYEKLIENVKYTFYICAYTDGPEGTYGRYSDGTEYVYRKNDDTSSSEPPAVSEEPEVSETPAPGPAPSREPQSSQEPDATTLKGDANGDNHLDLADAQLILKRALLIIKSFDSSIE